MSQFLTSCIIACCGDVRSSSSCFCVLPKYASTLDCISSLTETESRNDFRYYTGALDTTFLFTMFISFSNSAFVLYGYLEHTVVKLSIAKIIFL